MAVKFSRACQNGAQRLYHIRRLGAAALEAGTACSPGLQWDTAARLPRRVFLLPASWHSRACAPPAPGGRCVPSELVVLLAEDNDGDVRAALVEQLPDLGAACARLAAGGGHEGEADELAVTLLDTALRLVEDDVEAVVSAAETAIPALAPLFRPQSEPETTATAVCDPLLLLASSEEEEVRVSACRVAGALAQPLGSLLCDEHLVQLVIHAASDSSFRVRKAAAVALVEIARHCSSAAATDRILPALLALSADPVWTVRKAATDVLVPGVTAAAASPADAAEELLLAFTRLCADDDGPGPWVRNAALSALGPALVAIHTGGRPIAAMGLLRAHYCVAASNDDTALATATEFWNTCAALGPAAWPDVLPAFEALCGSPDRHVRVLLATSLPRLAAWMGPNDALRDLVPRFRAQCGDVAPEVAVAALEAALPLALVLPSRARPDVLCPILCAAAACGVHVLGERHACGAWRVRAAAFQAIEGTGRDAQSLFASDADGATSAAAADVAETMLPTALAGTRDPAAAVRAAAADASATLLAVVGHGAGDSAILTDACSALRGSGASGDYMQRLAFVRACSLLAGFAVSHPQLAPSASRLLQRELGPLLLSLANDQVASVRCAVARVLCGAPATAEAPALSGAPRPISWATTGELRDVRLLLENDTDPETRRWARPLPGAASAALSLSAGEASSPLLKAPRPSGIAAKHPLKLGLLQRRALESAQVSEKTQDRVLSTSL